MIKMEKIGIGFSFLFSLMLLMFPIFALFHINLLKIISYNKVLDLLYGLPNIIFFVLSYLFLIIGYIKNKGEHISSGFIILIILEIFVLTIFVSVFHLSNLLRIYLIPLITIILFMILMIIKIKKIKS